MTDCSNYIFKFAWNALNGLSRFGIDLLLFPFIAFYLLKDKNFFLEQLEKLSPEDPGFLKNLLSRIDVSIHRYVLGKFFEIGLVWVLSLLLFIYYKLPYAQVLAFSSGLSTLLPYVGVFMVSLPVALVCIAHWGIFSQTTLWCFGLYCSLQFIQGNLLSSIIYSEAVNLHPLTIILSICILGGIWGVAGMIFAVPVTSCLKIIVTSWPKETLSISRLWFPSQIES